MTPTPCDSPDCWVLRNEQVGPKRYHGECVISIQYGVICEAQRTLDAAGIPPGGLAERVAGLAGEHYRYREREQHFAKALQVADGGQYRNDWDGAISALVAERDWLQAIRGYCRRCSAEPGYPCEGVTGHTWHPERTAAKGSTP